MTLCIWQTHFVEHMGNLIAGNCYHCDFSSSDMRDGLLLLVTTYMNPRTGKCFRIEDEDFSKNLLNACVLKNKTLLQVDC